MMRKTEIQRNLLFGLQKAGKKAAEEYGFYEGSLLVLIEDLMPFLKRAGIKKKDWLKSIEETERKNVDD